MGLSIGKKFGLGVGDHARPKHDQGANLGVKHTGASVGGLNRTRSVMYE